MQVQRNSPLRSNFGEPADFVVIAVVASVVISIVAKSILGLAVGPIALVIGFAASKTLDSVKQSLSKINFAANHHAMGNLGVNS